MSASDSLSFALGQISSAVRELNKKNYKATVTEIHELIDKHGFEAERHLYHTLFSSTDFSGDTKNSGKDYQQTQFLTQECQTLITRPNFPSILCCAFENPDPKQKTLKPSPQLLPNVSRTLKLNKVQEVVFGLGLLKSSSEELKNHAGQFVKQKLPDLLRSYIDTDTGGGQEGGLSDIAIEVLHCLLSHIIHGPRELVGVGEDQINAFLDTLRKDFPKERVPVVLAPLLYPNAQDLPADKLVPDSHAPSKIVTEDDLAELMKEIGYVCCSSLEDCRNTLVQFGVHDIKPGTIAKAIGMMVKTAFGLMQHIPLQQNLNSSATAIDKKAEDENQLSTWNIELFIQVVKELLPGLNWGQVILDLDNPAFQVPSSEGLKLLMTACSRGLQEVFPVEVLYRAWNNTDGQLSWIHQLLTNSELFCFTDYPCEAVMLDTLKILPEEETRQISNWKSLNLVETLLRLAEAGHYESVKNIFSFPFKNCPDILLFALLQAKPTWHTLRNELLLQLIPIFLSNHPNAASVLQYAWNGQGQSPTVRQIVMQAMADWYMKGEQDQARLSRILDVAQDLKALSVLLNYKPLLFVIDLAALASRREYLKLDKWLNDKLREHQEKFAEALITFLKRRCPHLTGILLDKELPKSIQLPAETVIVMLTCLSNSQVPPGLADIIRQMITNHGPLTKPRPTPQAIGGALLKRQGSLDSALPTPLTSQVDPLPGLGLSQTTSAPNSQLPSFPPHPLSIPTSNLGAVGSIGSGLTQPIQKPSSSSQFSHLGMQPPATSNSGLGSSQSHIFQQLQQAGLGGTVSGSSTDSYRMLSGLNSHKPLGSSLLNQQQQQQQQAMMSQQHRTPTPEKLRQAPTDVSQVWPGMEQSFSKEVEDEANSYFQRIYNHPPNPTISIDEVLEMLKKFKDSPVKKERDIFLCMLRNLFEEYRFFPQYPDKELHTTACLFGGIIEQGLVTYMALGIALRYVLDALRKSYNSKMYMFGIAALDRFKTRLKDYPHYCQHLASIPHFRDFPPSLIEYIEYGQQSREPPLTSRALTQDQQASAWLSNMDPMASRLLNRTSLGSGSASPTFTTTAVTKPGQNINSGTSSGSPSPKPSSTSSDNPDLTSGTARSKEPSIANASNIDTLLGASEKSEIAQPPEHVQDKIHFIFNNISQSNLTTKAEEFKNAVQPEYLQWVAQYMVMKRASIEPNFHQLYIDFMDAMESLPDFGREIVKETFRNIKVLLQSEKVPANFSDRSLLKNLGHWLGLLTLARNKPILMRNLDLKSLIIEAYFKGQQELLYVVPFVAKVLESAAKSKVFKPPNPWIMAIMALLVELHQVPDLKLNLKFEVEVLCNTLSLEMKDIKPTELLKDVEKLKKITQQLSSPEKEKLALSTAPASGTTSVTTAGTQPSQTATPPPPQYAYHEINVSGFSGLAPHIQINPQIPLFQQNPHLKQFVRPSIERAVQELVHPVVERSIKICLTTAEMIVKKDFALDPEESRMRAAAHHMVRFMTAGMALITCREPLLVSITNTLRSSLQTTFRSANQQQKEMIEHAASVVSEENTELACSFIQKTAVEKVLPEMDKRLATEFDVRRHARSEGRRYCDPMILTYQAERMPEQIRLKVGGVNANQTAVYEEFARSIPGFKVPPSGETIAMPPLSKPMYDHGILSSESLGNMHSRQKGSIPPIHDDFRSVDKLSLDGSAFQSPFPQSIMPEEVVQILNKCAAEMEQHLHAILLPPSNPPVMTIHSLLDAVVQTRNSRDNNAAVRLLHKAVEGLLDEVTLPSDQELALRYRDCHLIVLRGLQDPRGYGINWTARHVTKFVCDCVPELKFNVEAIDLLIRGHLLNMREFDQHIVQCMDNGLNVSAVHFAIQLVKYVSDDKHATHVSESDLFHTIEALTRIAHNRQNPEGLSSILETVHNGPAGNVPSHHDVPENKAPGGPTSLTTNAMPSFAGYEDPPGLHEKVEYLLREWVRLCHQPGAGKDSEKAFSTFVALMHQQGILRSDDLITRFFRICTELCVDVTYRAIVDHPNTPTLARSKCFSTLDAYCRLIALLVRHSGDASNNVTKINLLNRVLSTVATVLFQDHEARHTDFQQLPYHRIFIMLLLELNQPEPVLEAINFQVLQTFSTVFHALKPSRAPGFAYAWLELISHRLFMSKLLLNTPQQKGWLLFQQLLIDLFKFLAPFLRNAELAKQTHLLYKGTLRVLLVLLHDFPEFLCDFHFSFCDVIPPNCIQMRNLILSAFPRNMRLPDPFTPNLKVDLLTDIAHSPRISTNFGAAIQPATFKKDLDSYLKTRAPVTFLTELRSHLQVSTEPGTRYNVPLMNALVLYVGTQAIAYIHSKSGTPSMSTITHSSHMDIFQNLAVDLDTEGRYLFLNAIANQLRYPNSHTHYFSCVLLYLFAEANTEAIQEQITRVLLERLIVNRPHPWGLLITFIELIKNHQYKFWTHEFVHCAPEIEKLFESVARSCMQQKQVTRESTSEGQE